MSKHKDLHALIRQREDQDFYDEREAEFRYLNGLNKPPEKVPILRGCPNPTCFCTGACREVIGYRERLPGEH